MKKRSVLVLALLMVGLLLTGCGEQDPQNVVVAEVNGEKIMKSESDAMLEIMLKQYVIEAAQYGQTVDPTNPSTIVQVKSSTLNMMAEGVALAQKAAELGEPITDEDRERFETDAIAEYEGIIESYMNNYSMTEDEAVSTLDERGFTKSYLEYMYFRDALVTRLRPFATEGITVTDEEVQADYDSHLASQKETYETTPTQFVNDVINNEAVYVQPEGFRYVKNLVLGFPDDIETQMNEKDNEYYGLMMNEYSLETELSLLPEDATDEDKKALQDQIDALKPQMTAMEAEIEALKAQGFEDMQAGAEEILAKAKEPDADFDALMDEHSIDTPTGTLKEKGYPVRADVTNYVPEFTAAAMALEKIGDISDLIATDYGYHILLYAGDVIPGPVPQEVVRADIEAHVLSEKQDTVLNEKMGEWIEAAKIKTYINRM